MSHSLFHSDSRQRHVEPGFGCMHHVNHTGEGPSNKKKIKQHILTGSGQLIFTTSLKVWGDFYKTVTWMTNEQSAKKRVDSPAVRKLSLPLSLLSRAKKKNNKKNTLVSSFPRFFFSLHILLPPLLPAPSPLWWMEGMNSPRPPRVSLWGPRQLNKQHALKLKDAIRNLFEPCTFCVYLCMALQRSKRIMENRVFFIDVITQNLFFSPLLQNLKL